MAESLRYPLATLEKESDYLFMSIDKYKPAGFTGNALRQRLSRGLGNTRATTVASIILPIPTTITDSNGVSWGSGTLNALERIGLGGITGAMETNNILDAVKGAVGSVGGIAGKIKEAQDDNKLVTTALATKILQGFGSNITLDQIIARRTGQILNPNMELLFNGPTLRQFNFNFQFSPRNEKEAAQVKRIITVIKKAMSPKLNGGGNTTFISTPDIFQMSYKKGSGDHPFLNTFKPMALTNMNVDYTGTGTYATYSDGTPVVINMVLALQELSPIYAEDYDNVNHSGVGY